MTTRQLLLVEALTEACVAKDTARAVARRYLLDGIDRFDIKPLSSRAVRLTLAKRGQSVHQVQIAVDPAIAPYLTN